MARHRATVCFDSPIGRIEVEAAPAGVTRVRLRVVARERVVGEGPALDHASAARAEISAYLAGKLRTFTVACVLDGTAFQRATWAGIAAIPYGERITYGELASRVGHPRSARAIGAACRANPVPLLIPCHRVVAGDGALRGFGAGLPVKQALLALEERFAAAAPARRR